MIDKLKENYENLGVNNEKQEKRVPALESKATQLVIGYVFYQGIIFICISQSSNLRCDDWWLPFSLSLSLSCSHLLRKLPILYYEILTYSLSS